MKVRDVGSQPCSVARGVSVVGDPWTLLVLREAFLGTRRFEGFHAGIGASRAILADRLEKLVAHGIFEKRAYQEKPTRHEYRLTEKGVDLYPVITTLADWGDKWLDQGRGRPVERVHSDCGAAMSARLHCSECAEPLDPRRIFTRPGPGFESTRPTTPLRPERTP